MKLSERMRKGLTVRPFIKDWANEVAALETEWNIEASNAERWLREYQEAETKLEAMKRERIVILARFYTLAPIIVGALCDEVLDSSGQLLGSVRKEVLATEGMFES